MRRYSFVTVKYGSLSLSGGMRYAHVHRCQGRPIERGWVAGYKTYVPDLCRVCSAAFYAENERRLREIPDENREYQAQYAHACGYRD